MALILRLIAPWSQGGCCSAKHHLLTQEHLSDWQVLSLWSTVTLGITQKCFLPVRTFAYAVPYAWPVSPFFLCAGNHHPSQNPVQASALSRLPVSPTLSATIKAYLHPDAIAHLSVLPQETVSSMRQELRLVCFWFLCAVHRAWLVYIYWLNEQAAEGNCSSAILNSENQIALCTGHRVNARDVPLPRESDPADLVPVTLSRVLENDPKGLIRPLSTTGKWWDFKGADKRSWIFLPRTLGL